MAVIAAGRVITPGYKGPRTCQGCGQTDSKVLFDLDLIGPLNPDICLKCLVKIENEVNAWLHSYFASELADIRAELAGRLSGACH